MYDASSSSESTGSPPRRERTVSPSPTRSFSDDTLEGLLDRSMDATLQAATDVKTLVEMLHLLLQRFRVQMLRLESESAQARAERSQIQRQVEQQREEAEVAAWELRQELEREGAQARARLREELAALRAQAEEEARRIRLQAEREAAALLAAAQSRRAELLADLQPWRRELEGVRERLAREGLELPSLPTTEDVAVVAPGEPADDAAAPPATEVAPSSQARPAPTSLRPSVAEPAAACTSAQPAERQPTAGAHPEPAPTAARADEAGTSAEVVFLRVPDTRRAIALEAAVGAIPGVTACHLREFERGRLVLDVEHQLGQALADRVRGLADFDLRLTTARDGHLEFQVL